MKNDKGFQLNRGRCVYRSFKKQEVMEDKDESLPSNHDLDEGKTKATVSEAENKKDNPAKEKTSC